MTVLPTTSGCAYTSPLTGVSKSCVNDFTAAGPMADSLWSQPVRWLSPEAVTSSAPVRAVSWMACVPDRGATMTGLGAASAGSTPSVIASPAAAASSRAGRV